MLQKKSLRIIFIIILIIAGFYGISKISKKENYPIFNVKRGEFLIDIYADGLVEAGNSTIISSPSRIWGDVRIIKLVDEGQYVKQGDFLIQFDPTQFTERIQTLENELEKARAAYESEVANIEKTRADLESQLKIEEYSLEQTRLRAKNAQYEAENKRKEIEYSLKKAEISYQQLVDKIEKNKEINKASLRQAELKVSQEEISLQRAREDLEKLTITSPGEGIVVYKQLWGPNGREKVKVGSTPWRSQQLLEIPDKSNKKVIINVNEVNISSLKIGQKVNIRIDALPEKLFQGEITHIASLAHEDEDSGKKVFEVEVVINEIFDALKPGMSANCQIIVEQIPNVISIPIDAVTKKDDVIGVYNALGKFIPVKTSKVSSDLILVEEGLKEGDQIRLIKTEDAGIVPQEKKLMQKAVRPEHQPRVMIHG
ncbi:MAG: efflux RND transporter periplasmic adaptor subunit [Candidatus Marinimicrobia bacterium]|nr:efflux RND transporter periplasmic adaptor subunit [Candidatus Neomarinimicrobiota bacterium]